MQLRDDPARRRALGGLILPDGKKSFCGRKQIASVSQPAAYGRVPPPAQARFARQFVSLLTPVHPERSMI
jgi:hypothetical protein